MPVMCISGHTREYFALSPWELTVSLDGLQLITSTKRPFFSVWFVCVFVGKSNLSATRIIKKVMVYEITLCE